MIPIEILQYTAWLIALIEFIIGLYVLVLNSQHTANRHVSVSLLILSVNTFALGALAGADNASQAQLPAILISMTSAAIMPVLTLTSVALLKSTLFSGRWGWIHWIPRVAAVIPAALVFSDLVFSTHLWFTGFDPQTYQGGYVPVNAYTQGSLYDLVSAFNFAFFATISIGLLINFSFFDRTMQAGNKNLAKVLLAANVVSGLASAAQMGSNLLGAWGYLFSSFLFLGAYGFAAFQQMISERRLQRGSLQTRLTALILVVTLPLAIALTLFLAWTAKTQIEEDALERLTQTSHSVSDSTSAWLGSNNRALQNLITNENILSLQADRQKPLLENMAAIYPEIYLISTTDTNGFNIARNDDEEPKDYKDRYWFQEALNGNPVTYQSLIGRTSGQPALVASMPIRDSEGKILGVGMYASDLDEVSHLVEHARGGDGSIAYVIDERNQLIAHPDRTETSELKDLSKAPPVQALRSQGAGLTRFADESGDVWRAYVEELDNGWGVIVQQRESDLLAPVRTFQRVALIILVLAAILLVIMAVFTIRQGIRPIGALTEAAEAIITGDLMKVVPVDSDDELGLLARTFNSMTEQLRTLIAGLETRVEERTTEVEQRALQLQVTAEVAREAAAIRDLEQLLENVVQLISIRFGFYHAGIFLLSERQEQAEARGALGSQGYAVLRAASSTGGQRMLARGHKLAVSEEGIVGYAAGTGRPRIALDVGRDAVFFDNPDLPETRSEMALPLKVQNRVIGVLDVQSIEAGAFSDEDIAILQILADQIALAIENARLLQESQQALVELRAFLGAQVREGWNKQLEGRSLAFSWDLSGIRPLSGAQSSMESDETANDGHSKNDWGILESSLDQRTIQIPIQLRGQRLGSIVLRRQSDQEPWSGEEREIIEQSAYQMALALENARLLEEIQDLADREQRINWIATQVGSSVTVETILQNTVRELGKALGANRTFIQIGSDINPPRHIEDPQSNGKTALSGDNGRNQSSGVDEPGVNQA